MTTLIPQMLRFSVYQKLNNHAVLLASFRNPLDCDAFIAMLRKMYNQDRWFVIDNVTKEMPRYEI